MTKTDEASDVFKTISYKYDSQLVIGSQCKENGNKTADHINSWSVQAVSNFIKSIPGCSSFASLFEFEVIIKTFKFKKELVYRFKFFFAKIGNRWPSHAFIAAKRFDTYNED